MHKTLCYEQNQYTPANLLWYIREGYCQANAYIHPKQSGIFTGKKPELPWAGFKLATSRVLDRCSTCVYVYIQCMCIYSVCVYTVYVYIQCICATHCSGLSADEVRKLSWSGIPPPVRGTTWQLLCVSVGVCVCECGSECVCVCV